MRIAGVEGQEEVFIRRLHLVLEPSAAYDILFALAPGRLGARPKGVYLAQESGGFAKDRDAGPSPLPDTWHPVDSPLDASLVPVVYHYRGRPLGAMVFAEADAVDPVLAAMFLNEHFAPAFFRAAYLSDVLREAERQREQLRILQEMGTLVGRFELEPLLVSVLDILCGFLGASVACILLTREDGVLETAVEWGLPQSLLGRLTLSDGSNPVERAMQAREPMLVRRDDLHLAIGEREEPIPARLLLLPLTTSTRVLGCVVCVSERVRGRITEEALEVLRPAVGLAATAIENATLAQVRIEREKERQQLEIARHIQAGLLPSGPPPVAGIDLAASSVPASLIGGDYYDYFLFPDGGLGLLVADVAGKGVPAGLIMTAARATFRSVVLEHGSPATILGRVNRILAEEDFNHRFVTAILARVDLAGSRLTVSTAAHEPLMLVRAGTDQVERIGRPALPLGVSPEATYEDITVPLGPGDRFLLYTDGVTEAMNAARVPFGPDALARLLALPVGGAEELRRAVLRAVASHVGAAPRHDDTTLMAACVSAYPSDG